MKRLWPIIFVAAIYCGAYFITPGPVEAVKRLRLSSILALGNPIERVDGKEFDEFVEKFAQKTNSNTKKSLYEMLSENKFVQNPEISIKQEMLDDVLLSLSYKLEGDYILSVYFVTNKKRFIPNNFSVDGFVNGIYSKTPTPIKFEMEKNGVQMIIGDNVNRASYQMPDHDKLLIRLLGQIFQNEPERILEVPMAIETSLRKRSKEGGVYQFSNRDNNAAAPSAPSSAGAPQKQLTPEQFFNEAAKNASNEYAARWDAIQNDPQAFFNKCVSEEVSIAVKLGGASEEETKKRAKATCSMKLANLKSCMDKPAAKAANCFADVLESGD